MAAASKKQQEDVMNKPAAAASEKQSVDAQLRARAQRVVPGGMWGHLNAARLPEGYPQFFASAEGCRVRDVDGREYIDFMCSWGPVLLGHRHPEVQAAAEAQAALGDCFNGPGEVMVELGFDFSAWNGWKADIPASLSVGCGAFSPVVGNRAVVSFDPEASPTLDLLREILRAAVTAFDPEDGVVVSDATLSAHPSLSIVETPAVFRYERGAGFSAD